MRFFQRFPTVTYTTTEVVDGIEQTLLRTVPNMTARFAVDMTAGSFTYYTVQDRDRPDTLAAQWYGSSRYTWVVLLSNNMRDLYDWPMSSKEFADYITTKYTDYVVESASISAAGSGYVANDVVTINGTAKTSATLKITSVNGSGNVTGIQILDRGSYANTSIPATSNNVVSFAFNGANTAAGNRTGLELNLTVTTGIPATQILVHEYQWNDANTGQTVIVDREFYDTLSTADKDIVYVYDHENDLNDARRQVKKLTPDAFTIFVNQFNRLIGESSGG